MAITSRPPTITTPPTDITLPQVYVTRVQSKVVLGDAEALTDAQHHWRDSHASYDGSHMLNALLVLKLTMPDLSRRLRLPNTEMLEPNNLLTELAERAIQRFVRAQRLRLAGPHRGTEL